MPASVKQQASTQLISGVPFLSDKQLTAALDEAGVAPEVAQAILRINADARLQGLRVAFGLTALLAAGALFLTRRIPTRPPGGKAADAAAGPASADRDSGNQLI